MPRLSLFGSQPIGTAGPHSDIDLLAEFDPDQTPGLIELAGIEIELSEMLRRKAAPRTPGDLSDEVVRTVEVCAA